jgi:hypothetical protein
MLLSCLKSLAIFIVAVVVGLYPPIANASPADINVLLITIDTLRPDRLSCYSSKYVQTPRIDALAARGVLFERAFAHDPITLPSHTNILLGLTSLVHGVNENVKSVVSKEFVTLAEALKKKGYATGAFVSAFPLDSRFGLNRGFDVYDDRYPRTTRSAKPKRPSPRRWPGFLSRKESGFAGSISGILTLPIRRPSPMPASFRGILIQARWPMSTRNWENCWVPWTKKSGGERR